MLFPSHHPGPRMQNRFLIPWTLPALLAKLEAVDEGIYLTFARIDGILSIIANQTQKSQACEPVFPHLSSGQHKSAEKGRRKQKRGFFHGAAGSQALPLGDACQELPGLRLGTEHATEGVGSNPKRTQTLRFASWMDSWVLGDGISGRREEKLRRSAVHELQKIHKRQETWL